MIGIALQQDRSTVSAFAKQMGFVDLD